MMLILTENELRECVSFGDKERYVIEQAFASLSKGEVEMPPIQRLDIREHNGEIDIKSAYIKGANFFTVKMSTGFFDNYKLNLSSGNGLMILFDAKTGIPRALLLDNGYLTDLRTGLAGAVAAKYIAPRNVNKVGIVGAGKQAQFQLQALQQVRPYEQFYVHCRNSEKAQKFATLMSKTLGIEGKSISNLQSMIEQVEILITATPAKEPVIDPLCLHDGLHITAMGSDSEEKQEIHSKVFENTDHLFCDSKSQCMRLGEHHHAYASGVIDDDTVITEIGEIISGKKTFHRQEEDKTLCDLTGTGVQDTAIASLAYERALQRGLGSSILSSGLDPT